MSLRRGGTPLTGAVPSLEASNQAQIDDLVQRNRTLEHTNKKLSEQVAQETTRSKEAVVEIQRQWEVNQRQWKEGCEEILASYRIVQKQVEVELEKERSAVIKEMTITREEKLQRLQRDYKLKLFQMKEEELERKIEEIEEEKAYLAEESELTLRKEREKGADYAAKLKETRESLTRSIKEKEEKEAKYNRLVAEHSNMEASAGTLDSKLQRTQLQLEGAQTKMADLERVNDELRRSNTDLTRQLERWQNLETKGGEAAEKQHKQRIALEFELRELKEEYENQTQELAKAKKKVDKMTDVAANYESESKEQEKAATEANKKLAKLQKQVDKLKAELEVERARVRPPSPQKIRPSSPPAPEPEIEADDVSDDEPIRKGKSSTTKPGSKQAATAKAGPSTTTASKPPKPAPSQTARKTTGGRPPRALKTAPAKDTDVEEISEPEIIDAQEDPAPSKKRKGKTKAVEIEVDEGEVEEEAPAPRRRNNKRKAVEENNSDEDEVQIVEKPKTAKKGSRAPSQLRETAPAKKPPSKLKGGGRAASRQPVADSEADNEDDGGAQKKKKRKILFNTANPGPFAFDSLLQFEDKGLNIPSILSPVRPDEPVPQRSTTSSLVSGFGNIMKFSTLGTRK
ncbi:hypothetical protein BDZ97DRAFT_1727506 [Flammula alnicola]|nr:hypothetical protein BDZ97DRAFT_1727506 [Flammula alnicola]